MPIFKTPTLGNSLGLGNVVGDSTIGNNTVGVSTTSSTIPSWQQMYNGPVTSEKPLVKRRRTPKWEQKFIEAAKLPERDLPFEISGFYKAISADSLIELLGDYNPLYAGRPKKHVETLLKMAHPIASTPMMYTFYVRGGLAFRIPYLPGRRKTRLRLTAAGIKLLDHWAEKHRRFKPFVDAYLPNKARKEINLACIDFEFGSLPAFIREDLKKQAELSAKMDAEKLKAQMIEMQKYIYDQQYIQQYQSMLSQVGQGVNQLWNQAAGTSDGNFNLVRNANKQATEIYKGHNYLGSIPDQYMAEKPGILGNFIDKMFKTAKGK